MGTLNDEIDPPAHPEYHQPSIPTTTPNTGAPAPVPSSPTVEADPNDGDQDDDATSDYESDVSDTTSLNSSLFHYQYENGRTYHAHRAGQYLLPNDELEQERLDITHHLFSLTLNGALCVSKLDAPKRILDLGTGTGIWAIDVGDLYPAAEVIGTDLSPIQSRWFVPHPTPHPFRVPNPRRDTYPPAHRVPSNVRFEIDDATLEWTFPRAHFDFIHARTLGGAIADWPALLRRCHKHLVPGGQLEVSEGRTDFWCDDGSLPADSATSKWLTEFRRLARPLGFDISPKLPGMLKEAGFTDVEFRQRVVPCGTWPKDPALKEIGRWFQIQFLEMALESYSLALFTREGGWTSEETQVLFAKVRKELRSNMFHIYTYTAFVTGKKN
ncbi:S-adenosyl-L-methionine-dependent methyltransferase [Lasiosphaeris hirsuta]|uniref:S-adenosyl-L-methionine-dependent methyltransferase n=1 Tax=Lasiosphaeris hirsuta TaxID=260670 RepID=A0AA40A9K2_9PEZI|nr:S-adenosyl-L-methionine-dependent methyltransferase [Lasiosphaeris hirsuta]